MTDDVSRRRQFQALADVVRYRPITLGVLVVLGLGTAALEGISATFIIPIIESARLTDGNEESGIVSVFSSVYEFLGIPFVLEYIILGVAITITVRYAFGFLIEYYSEVVRTNYVRKLQSDAFKATIQTRVEYLDRQGSDEILNVIVTQARYAGEVVTRVIQITKTLLISGVYAAFTLYLAPILTVLSVVVLGVFIFLIRYAFKSGYSLGDMVADANESIQSTAQAGTQGIRDVKLFGMERELFSDFKRAVDRYANTNIKYRRNQSAMNHVYQLASALSVFVLIYAASTYTALTIAELGAFLFAMFRLAPRVSTINSLFYQIEANLPHLVRTQDIVDEFDAWSEPESGDRNVPERLQRLDVENVSFAYQDERVLDGVSFSVERGEFVAFVGPSGAGKSTIASLLTQLYEVDDGTIRGDGTPIDEFDVSEWRSKFAVVRQHPFIFNDNLRYNVTVGDRTASDAEIRRACELAHVTEFLDELPDGLDTELGDDGVRLSGGQRQRIAIARALLTDADVLVLDEATSDLDTYLETEVHRGIESEGEGRILIVIAHRLSTIVDADRIYTMEDGRIVEAGDHSALMEADGAYASLYTSQVEA